MLIPKRSTITLYNSCPGNAELFSEFEIPNTSNASFESSSSNFFLSKAIKQHLRLGTETGSNSHKDAK